MMSQLKSRSLRGLDYINFSLADVRDGIGPFLGIYLLSVHHWNLKDIGIVSSIATFAGVVVQTPAGAFTDRFKNKKIILAIASLLIGFGTLLILIKPDYSVVIVSQVIVGIAATFVGPSVAAMTLGLVGYKKLEARTGRNEMFNHSGNVSSALISGLIGYYIGLKGIFIFTLVLSIVSVICLQLIDNDEIDYKLSRGSLAKDESENSGDSAEVLRQPLFIIFTVCCVLYHFANAAMLPMAGQYIVSENKVDASVYMSACIVIAQLFMVPTAAWCSRKAVDGRKWLMLVCFAILPIRGLLYTFSANPFFITSVQVLDGISAGIFGVVSILIIADLTKGSGHFNLANGILITAVGLGASFSNVAAGYIANVFSFKIAFLFLSAVAALAFVICLYFMKETYNPDS
ncbi:MFS transporter [Dyadobacter subterraneus]|uniref:MFS transporter n=1 Tax=Dyadobacter subterraneus TaxID=2773304 RepID=A0ABR9WHU8_9BACT|nr:MFS transporter [Dyadobacter subterraneus]MBE9463926.1 MFS transporter [Dyadobacter subterraneus]